MRQNNNQKLQNTDIFVCLMIIPKTKSVVNVLCTPFNFRKTPSSFEVCYGQHNRFIATTRAEHVTSNKLHVSLRITSRKAEHVTSNKLHVSLRIPSRIYIAEHVTSIKLHLSLRIPSRKAEHVTSIKLHLSLRIPSR